MNIIDAIKKERLFLLKLLEEVTIDEWNSVPPGFNNNIIWNLGHLVASQQGVCYLRAGLKTRIDEAFYIRFKPDTKPGDFISNDEVAAIKALLFSTLEQFEEDYQNGLFVNYNTWTTRYGATLTNIDDAMQFLLYHEGLHTGYIMALKRAVRRSAQ
jgi:hypothetical protein